MTANIQIFLEGRTGFEPVKPKTGLDTLKVITLEHSALERARVLPKGKLLAQQSAFNHSATAP